MASFHKHKYLSDGRRPECKECSRKRLLEIKENNPFEAELRRLADGILKRTKYAVDKPKNKTYLERGIKCLLGETRVEVKEQLRKHYGDDIKRLLRKGIIPSVDRLDPYGHYELGNIQIVSLKTNLSRVDHSVKSVPIKVLYPDGNVDVFESISDAANHLKCKRDTIYASLDRPGINKRGLKFELLKKNA